MYKRHCQTHKARLAKLEQAGLSKKAAFQGNRLHSWNFWDAQLSLCATLQNKNTPTEKACKDKQNQLFVANCTASACLIYKGCMNLSLMTLLWVSSPTIIELSEWAKRHCTNTKWDPDHAQVLRCWWTCDNTSCNTSKLATHIVWLSSTTGPHLY